MDRVELDVNQPLDRPISTLESAHISRDAESTQRFLRANGVIADGSYCNVCSVSMNYVFSHIIFIFYLRLMLC